MEKKNNFETIVNHKIACESMGIDPNAKVDTSQIPEKYRDSIESFYHLLVAYDAVNGNWEAQPENGSQYKYFPWAWFNKVKKSKKVPSGFVLAFSHFGIAGTGTACGFRLCSENSKKAMHVFKHWYSDYVKFWIK